MLTNIPAPYREKVHQIVSALLPNAYHVIYTARRESDREWDLKEEGYSRTYLHPRCINIGERHIHINFDIIGTLNKLNPNVVITTSYNPTFLLAFVWCIFKHRCHIAMTDGWLGSEEDLTLIHRLIRRIVLRKSHAFIGASKRSIELFQHYGCNPAKIFQSQLCADNQFYMRFVDTPKRYDIMFAGQFIQRKLPFFFIEVASNLQKRLGRKCKALIIGSGPLKDQFLSSLEKSGIEYYYAGFVKQLDLPAKYSSAKIFLFPTRTDPWGVVTNEACASGLPVITCDNAGAAHDLIMDGKNGYVLPLQVDLWVEHICRLLSDDALYRQFSQASRQLVQPFSFENAAKGIVNAIQCAIDEPLEAAI